MGLDFSDVTDKGGERWLILNDRKQDDPKYLWFEDAEERQKKNGSGTLPVLLLRDENQKKFVCSAFPRQVEDIAAEWGGQTDNWRKKRIRLEPRGKGIALLPAEEAPKEEKISE